MGDLTRLLNALDRDYRDFAGRRLTVRSVRRGSLEIDLVELGKYGLEAAGAVVTIKEFVKLVQKAITQVKDSAGKYIGSDVRGMATVRAMLKMSRGSHADVSLALRGDEDETSAVLTRADAETIYLDSLKEPKSSPAQNEEGDLEVKAAWTDRDVVAFAEAAAEMGADPDLLEAQGSAAFELLKVLVSKLTSSTGGDERLKRISEELRASGREAAAHLLHRLMAKP